MSSRAKELTDRAALQYQRAQRAQELGFDREARGLYAIAERLRIEAIVAQECGAAKGGAAS